MNRIYLETMMSLGYKGTADLWELIAMVRAAQAALRCVALYKVSPMELVRKATQGDRRAILDLIKVDKLFLMDSCTSLELRKALLAGDDSFLDQVARAIQYRRRFDRRDACRIYLLFLFGTEIELPTVHRLRQLSTPNVRSFAGNTTLTNSMNSVARDVLRSTRIIDADQLDPVLGA